MFQYYSLCQYEGFAESLLRKGINLLCKVIRNASGFVSPAGSDAVLTNDALISHTADRAHQYAQRRGIYLMVDRINHEKDYGIDQDDER